MCHARKCVVALLALVSTTTMAGAGTITTYTDRPTFEAALGVPFTVEDFTDDSHFPISTGILNSATDLPDIGIAPGDIQPGVTYSTAIGDSFFFNIDAGGGYEGGFLDGFAQSAFANELTVTFDGPVKGFGFDTNSLMGTEFSITINFISGPAYTNSFSVADSSALEFFGFTSDATDITSAVILGNDSFFSFALDNFTFGPAGVIPEPSSIALAGLGALGLLGLARKRRKVA